MLRGLKVEGQQCNTAHKCASRNAMDDFDDFEVVFGNNSNIAYEKAVANGITERRSSLEDELFIDRLLKALGVQKGTTYIGDMLYSILWSY